ncbi:unnamed protein product, partial [marine sediment metagenome]
GNKFKNNDTLLAKITPCLENGKTAFVNVLEKEEVAFGSSEFIVLSGKPGKIDPKFLYYLTIEPNFRKATIRSMTGTSGRQRVQNSILENILVALPIISEQIKIAKILSLLDDKIELNNEINKTLEQISQSLFKQWFVNFEFPNEHGQPYKSSGGEFIDSGLGKIPKGWTVRTLEDCIILIDNRGKTPPLATQITPYPIIDVKALSGESRIINYKNCTKYVEEETYNSWFRSEHPKQQDILISTVGSLAEIKLFLEKRDVSLKM